MKLLGIISTLFLLITAAHAWAEPLTLLNVSYDPTREFYQAYNPLFIKYWHDKTGQDVKIQQSHGGSAKQARAVMDGLKADVVTLALAYDIDNIAERTDLIPTNWQDALPHASTPFNSTIVFLVHKGNPKNIKDWDDLIKPDVEVITPNPKTSGGARWNYLAAWGYALEHFNHDEAAAQIFITSLYRHVPILDAGARGATTSFVERGIGDVLIAWENEALFVTHTLGKDEYEIVVPSVSILAEPPVAVVEKNARKKAALAVAQAYLEYMYSPPAQSLAADHYYRPSDPGIAAQYTALFPTLHLITVKDLGGWKALHARHFAEGGVFDQIYNP